jgi:hypothetical protein
MRRLIITTASVIALSAGLSFTGTTPADAADASSPGAAQADVPHQAAAETKGAQQKKNVQQKKAEAGKRRFHVIKPAHGTRLEHPYSNWREPTGGFGNP